MNRRNFFGGLLKAGAGFAILPAATLYARKWKFNDDRRLLVPNPDYVSAQYECYFIDMPPMLDERIWDAKPLRFNMRGDGTFEKVEQFMAQV